MRPGYPIELCAYSRIAPTARPCVGPNHIDTGWFDPKPYLGERGHKYLSAGTRLLSAAMLALEHELPLPNDRDNAGVVVGTNFGNFDVLVEFTATIANAGAEALPPMAAPNFSVNVAASQLAIRYGLRAFNITLTQDTRAGVDALLEGALAIERERASVVVAGAVEPTLPTACLPADGETDTTAHLGAGLFVLKQATDGRAALVTLLRGKRVGPMAGAEIDRYLLAPLTADLPAPTDIAIYSPLATASENGQVRSSLARRWPGVTPRERIAYSSLAALAEIGHMQAQPGIHMLLCRDRYGATTGLMLSVVQADAG